MTGFKTLASLNGILLPYHVGSASSMVSGSCVLHLRMCLREEEPLGVCRYFLVPLLVIIGTGDQVTRMRSVLMTMWLTVCNTRTERLVRARRRIMRLLERAR